jgi:hypothetical protein
LDFKPTCQGRHRRDQRIPEKREKGGDREERRRKNAEKFGEKNGRDIKITIGNKNRKRYPRYP